MTRALKAFCFIFTGTVALFLLVNLAVAYFYP